MWTKAACRKFVEMSGSLGQTISVGRHGRTFVHGAGLLLALAAPPACSESIISVLSAHSLTKRAEAPITVTVDATNVRLPMRVSGTAVAYSDVDRALARSIEVAAERALPKVGLEPGQRMSLFVEIIEARAEYAEGRLIVILDTRATLRRVRGNAYIAQTHAHVSHSGHVRLARGGPVVVACTDSIAAHLSGWLLGLDLH